MTVATGRPRSPAQQAAALRASEAAATRRRARTHCSKGHELTPDNVYSRADRPGSRECLTCRRVTTRQWDAKHPESQRNYRTTHPERPRIWNRTYHRRLRRDCDCDETRVLIARAAALNAARTECAAQEGELAQLVAQQIKDERSRQWGTSHTVSLDKVGPHGYELYDSLLVRDYQDDLEERLERMAGY